MKKTMAEKVPPFGLRDQTGYLLGDLANDFTFILASTFLMKFYTNVLGIRAGLVGTLFLVARILDAFTDVTMGRIVDRKKAGKNGRFRPWILRMCGPVALASFLMYQSWAADLSEGIRILYMYLTYLLWGSIFYTAVNIPYGSMASAITQEPAQRTSLSTFRGVGATLAGLLIGTVVPKLVYDANGMMIGPRMTVVAGCFSLLAVLCYLLCYRMTTERVKPAANPAGEIGTKGARHTADTGTENSVRVENSAGAEQSAGSGSHLKTGIAAALLRLLSSRALLGIIGAAIFLLLGQLFTQSMNQYLYPDYFRNIDALSLLTLLTSILGLGLAPFVGRFSSRLGKKEVAAGGVLFTAVIYLLLYFLHWRNPWGFTILAAVGSLGINFFNLVIWANITDVIDDQEVRTGIREDGTIYAVYSFARKLGQAFAGGAGGWVLDWIGYQAANVEQSERVLTGIYTAATLLPAVFFLLVVLMLGIVYPLNRRRVLENARLLKEKRNREL